MINPQETKSRVVEGGNAAISLLPALEGRPGNEGLKFEYKKIPVSFLSKFFPKTLNQYTDTSVLSRLLSVLEKNGLVRLKGHEPSFSMGSTRFAAALIYGKDFPGLVAGEDEETVKKASGFKTEFGDLDIDVSFADNVKTSDITDYINKLQDPRLAAMKTSEVHIAYADLSNISDGVVPVYQIDLVDTKEHFAFHSFSQSSSIKDMSQGLKGLVATEMVVSLMKFKDPNINMFQASEFFESLASDDPERIMYDKAIRLGYRLQHLTYSLRQSDKPVLVAVFGKEGVKGVKKIPVSSAAEDPAIPLYSDGDLLAKFLLSDKKATYADIYSAIEMADFIRENWPEAQINKFMSLADKHFINHGNYKSGLRALIDGWDLIKNRILYSDQSPLQERKMSLMKEATARRGIGRFFGASKFSGPKMLEVFHNIISGENDIDIVEKMDSSFAHFGVDGDSEFFMQSSNSGEVTRMSFRKKFNGVFMKDFFHSFQYLNFKNKGFKESMNKLFQVYGPIKFDAELFPVLTHKGENEIMFVGTSYSRDKLGKMGAFVLFSVNLWDEENQTWYRVEPNKNSEIQKELKMLSQRDGWWDDWKIYTNDEDMVLMEEVPVIGETIQKVAPIIYQALSEPEPDFRSLARDKEIKQEMADAGPVLQDELDNIAESARSVLGNENSYIEGVVLRIRTPDGGIFEVKGTSNSFDVNKKETWKYRSLLGDAEGAYKNELFAILGINPRQVNKAISATNTNSDISSYDGFILDLYRNLEGNPPKSVDVKNILNTIAVFERELEAIAQAYEERKASFDIDTQNKTQASIDMVTRDVLQLKSELGGNKTPGGEAFILFMSLIGFKLSKNQELSSKPYAHEAKETVVLWAGRAQPWHVGHNAMAQIGKANGQKVMIVVVKGEQGTTDNPLDTEEQLQLIKAIYANDPNIEVATQVSPRAFLFDFIDILENAYDKKIIGWLAGEDRVSSYEKQIVSFNNRLLKNEPGADIKDIEMIITPRVFSGAAARKLALELSFKDWLNIICGGGNTDMYADPSAAKKYTITPLRGAQEQYLNIYNKIRQISGKNDEEKDLAEISGVAGGGLAFGSRPIIGVDEDDEQNEQLVNEVMNYLLGISVG